MIKFIKTELKDITEFKKYLPQNDAVSCDGTVGGIFMWFDEFNTHHAVVNDTLIQKITVSGEDMFALPYGKDVTGAVFEIYNYCGQNSIPCKFYGVTDNFIKINKSCIANLKKIKRFDASFGGAMQVTFKNGHTDFVSRRNLKNVKERMGI